MLILLLLYLGLGFSIPAILVEKEVINKSSFSESHKKVKIYRAKGYEKEVWEEKTTFKGNPLGQIPFMQNFMKNAPGQGPKTQINRGEKITHFKKGKVVTYTLDPDKKTYMKNELEGRMLLMGFMMILDCNQQGKCRPKVEPTKEVKRIGKWKARKVIVRVNMMGREVPAYHWFTKDSKLLLEADRINIKNVLRAVGNDPQISPFLKSAKKALEKIEKDYGAIVKTETPFKSSTTVEVVKSVKRINVPKSFFQVPKGYREFKPPLGGYNIYRQR